MNIHFTSRPDTSPQILLHHSSRATCLNLIQALHTPCLCHLRCLRMSSCIALPRLGQHQPIPLLFLLSSRPQPLLEDPSPCPAILAMHESTIHQKASSSFCSARASEQGPLYPTLRANPFPEVTDLFCRLPLPTLFYRPEAANLGDLMRLWVRTGV